MGTPGGVYIIIGRKHCIVRLTCDIEKDILEYAKKSLQFTLLSSIITKLSVLKANCAQMAFYKAFIGMKR